MSFETTSLLLNWVQLGVLLAILFRLGHTFALIANTQRELRRTINRLGEQRAMELNAVGGLGSAAPRSRWMPVHTDDAVGADDLAPQCREVHGLRSNQSPAPVGDGVSLSV